MDRNLKTLEEFGLSNEEARIYMAGISLGPTTMLKLAQTAEIQRTSAYRVVESLRQKGLIKIELKGFKHLYAAESPYNLKQILESKLLQMTDLLPALLQVYNKQGKDTLIKYYEGIEGVKGVYETILRETRRGEPYFVISSHQEWYELDQKWFEGFSERRNRERFDFKFLLLDSEPARLLKQREDNFGIKVKILPSSLDFTSILILTKDRIWIHNLELPIEGLVIENKDMISMLLQVFNIMWEGIPS
jgi:sugar-specific transcriptional regulator TrmB